ncbi:MAG: NAD(P)/FAD-dependent oxidoreductase [Candidatus Delongbacteria bacterium]|nr:NAD(P)/FAD-dependent oxidoreductase [Candidatus Delongbacteria bacterium]
MTQKTAIIIGAGPAGLTAAYELLKRTTIKPIIFEKSFDVGGISKTVNYKGNRIDIGGHRFFSKSDRITNWWQNILPLAGKPAWDDIILSRSVVLSESESAPDPESTDLVMLTRNRLSRIFFLRSFFDYPISLKWHTFNNLGVIKVIKIGFSYIKYKLFPIRNEKTLEDFFINRFGKILYLLFFKDYTEKVWGVPCSKIKPEWGAQRIKELSLKKAVLHAFKNIFFKGSSVSPKNIETTLIEQFTYPKLGPGQLWEEVASQIISMGGEIYFDHTVIGLNILDNTVKSVLIKNNSVGDEKEIYADFAFSTMPVKELIKGIYPPSPIEVMQISEGLIYRDFITVGVLLKRMKIKNETNIPTINNIIPDNWIYVQERDVKLGRIQVFNNWSPYLLKDPDNIWLGLEYFCNEGDELWSKSDSDFASFAIAELEKIDIISKDDVLDSTVIRMPKTYPAYFGTYDQFDIVKDYTDKVGNLFLIGRNGMHKYNNADHSMLSAMVSVDNIVASVDSKENIWAVNTENEYHETK